jgi:hypothetical protein
MSPSSPSAPRAPVTLSTPMPPPHPTPVVTTITTPSLPLATLAPVARTTTPASPRDHSIIHRDLTDTSNLAPVAWTTTPKCNRTPRDSTRPNTSLLFPLVTPCDPSLLPPIKLNANGILHHLRNYPDPTFPQLLADISRFGVRVGYEGPSNITITRPNHRSAVSNPDVLEKNISKELSLGRIRQITSPQFHYSSPLGLVPKKTDGIQTGWRTIFDLSCPHGSSVNDNIPAHYGTLDYESFQHALEMVAAAGRNTVLLKKDLKAAFRHIPVSPFDYWLFVFHWNGKDYVDMFLPFGLRTAPRHFNLFAEALHWIFVNEYGWNLTHYLDDMLSIFPVGTDPHPYSLLYDSVCGDLGIETEPTKNEMGTRVTHLGLTIDTAIMEASLPSNKRNRAMKLVQLTLGKSWVSRRHLDELLGFLSHCCQVVPIGRPFLRQVFNLLQSATLSSFSGRPYAHITNAARQDLYWWLIFLNLWSCSIPIQTIDARQTYYIATDASGTKGIGGVFGDLVFSSRIPRGHRKKHINWKEMYAIYYALLLWFSHWQNGRVIIHCDNTTVVGAIIKRSVRGSVIAPLQATLLIAALFNIDLVAQWIPTDENFVADALSRHDFKRLANYGYVVQASELHRPHPTIPTSTLRRRLLASCGMASLPPLADPTPPLSTSSKRFPSASNSSHHSRSTSNHLPTGLPTSPPRSRSPQLETTSKVYDITISSTDSVVPSSTTLSSISLSVAAGESTATNPPASGYHSPPTYSSPLSVSLPLIHPSMLPTSKQPSALDSPPSSVPANSHGNGGILASLLRFMYHDNTLLSSTTASHSSSHPPRLTNTVKASPSTSRVSTLPYAPSPRSTIYSNGTRPHQRPHFSSAQLAYLSTEHTSSTGSNLSSYDAESTRRSTPGIHSAKAQQCLPSQLVSQKTKSNSWADGRAMLSTCISTKSTNSLTQNECLHSTQKFSNPSTPTLSLASSTTSHSTPTSLTPTLISTIHPACRVRRDTSVSS